MFRIVIARVEENSEEIADITTFVNAVSITTVLNSAINELNSTTLALKKHSESKMHLLTKIISNNVVNPEEIIDGGYFAYNTGKWVVRSDISTTGLIQCNKGDVYFCGIDFSNIRGGNCTFWNSGDEYISGIDVSNGANGFEIPDNDEIKFFRISFYTSEKSKFHINIGTYKEYDEFSAVYAFDKEIITPSVNSSKKENSFYYVQTYKDDVTVLHKRNDEIGTSYQTTVINKVKFDGKNTSVRILGTSETNALGDSRNKNVIDFATQNNFLHIINGGIYLVATGEADGITIINGEILKSTGVEQFNAEQYVLGITQNGDMRAYINKSAEDILNEGVIYAITGFVPLIQNGVAVADSVLSICPHYNVRHPRQIVGILADGNYFTFCCDGRTENENGMTLKECIETLNRDFMIQFAFNLDGGGSTQTTVGKRQINRMIDGRTIPNVITFE